jgi:hypothetical protein
MKNSWKWLLANVLLTATLSANAQWRPLVPIADFKSIPVVAALGVKLNTGQIEKAIVDAVSAERWEITSTANGVVSAQYVKEFKHTIEVTIPFSADTYSVIYKNSVNMNFATADRCRQCDSQLYVDAALRQKKRFAAYPESVNASLRTNEFIHPSYELWVRALIERINRQLKTTIDH